MKGNPVTFGVDDNGTLTKIADAVLRCIDLAASSLDLRNRIVQATIDIQIQQRALRGRFDVVAFKNTAAN